MTGNEIPTGFYIKRICFCFDPKIKPDVRLHTNCFKTNDDALEFARMLCEDEAENFNAEKVIGGLDFTGEESGFEEYDYGTLAWDGDDYRVVTGYKVIKMEEVLRLLCLR